MSSQDRRRQKAAEKRKQRELRVRREMSERRTAREAEGGRKASVKDLPLVECVISEGWEERGLAHVLIARRLPDQNLMVAGYYVDTLCLGIKDTALIQRISEEEYRTNLRENVFNDPVELVECDPALARAVIEGAVEFAGRFGFKPNKRWEESRAMLEGIGLPAKPPAFGRGGKPCFVDRGESNARGIVARLERTAGPGNYLVAAPEEDGGAKGS